MGLSVENPQQHLHHPNIKMAYMPPTALICCGWHALESFVTQTASHTRVGLTSVHRPRWTTHLTTPLYNRRGFSLELLQTRNEREPSWVGAQPSVPVLHSFCSLLSCHLPSSAPFCLGNGSRGPAQALRRCLKGRYMCCCLRHQGGCV